eukprot:2049993-Rhodomonas_salina.1
MSVASEKYLLKPCRCFDHAAASSWGGTSSWRHTNVRTPALITFVRCVLDSSGVGRPDSSIA